MKTITNKVIFNKIYQFFYIETTNKVKGEYVFLRPCWFSVVLHVT